LWDITDPAHLATAATLVSHRPGYASRKVAFSPDGQILASCGADKTLGGLTRRVAGLTRRDAGPTVRLMALAFAVELKCRGGHPPHGCAEAWLSGIG
jgi:hypothetical protein